MKTGDEVQFEISGWPHVRTGHVIHIKGDECLISVAYARGRRYYWKRREQLKVVKNNYVPNFPTPQERIDELEAAVRSAIELTKGGRFVEVLKTLERVVK